MVKNELYITVPSLFRCPISMDVMKSPVSLCTGVTYDRTSIQHWLDMGHDTCPATMQVLPSKDFIPNLTLHRLINLWIQSSPRRPLLSLSPSPAVSFQQVRVLVQNIEDGTGNLPHSLLKIVDFASYCEENRRFLVNLDGFVEVIVGVLSRECEEIEVLESVVKILDLILPENGVKEQLNRLILTSKHDNRLSSVVLILRSGKLNSKIESIRVLESIALDNESKRSIAEKDNLLSELVHLLKTENNPNLNDTVLSCLMALSVTRSIKTQLVRLGLVKGLSKTLLNSNKNDNSNSIHERALKLLSILSTCAEGRLAISEDENCAAAIVERLMKVSKTAAEDAVVVLWSMCCLYGDERVKEAVLKSNGVTKLLLVMQSGCEGSVRRLCGDLVKLLRVGYKPSLLGRYETKTTHIMPC